MKQDLINKINDQVIKGLESKGLEWFKPFKSGKENQPINRFSKKYYSGFNIFILNNTCSMFNYEHNQWMTFKQCSELGGKVKKGEKSNEIYFYKIGAFDNKTKSFVKSIKGVNWTEKCVVDGKQILRYKKTFSMRYFRVFNISQTTGIEPLTFDKSTEIEFTPNEMAKDLVFKYFYSNKPLKLTHSDSKGCYYQPNRDVVNMIKPELFCDSDSYYKTLFHEMSHSTGHKSRLNRATLTGVANFGDDTYSKEELVAEITSMYLTGLTGIQPTDSDSNSQAYINGWITFAKEDKRNVIVHAMTQASKSSDFILDSGKGLELIGTVTIG